MSKRLKTNHHQDDPKVVRENSAGWMVKSLGVRLDTQMEMGLKPLGLSISQFAIIMTLLENDGLTQVEIGRKISMPGYATTRNIDKLENLGYAKRQKHESSRRSYRIFLTDKSNSIAPKLYSLSKDVTVHFLAPLNEKDKGTFLSILSKLLG